MSETWIIVASVAAATVLAALAVSLTTDDAVKGWIVLLWPVSAPLWFIGVVRRGLGYFELVEQRDSLRRLVKSKEEDIESMRRRDCHKCGGTLRPRADYCHGCGTPTRG